MKPKPLPSRLRRAYGDMPTLDILHDAHPALKLYQLRAMLRDVTCYRCPDQSVRYVAVEATEALTQTPPEADDGADDEADDEAAPTAMALYNQSLRNSAAQHRQTSEMLRVYEGALRAMVEPLKQGCSMLVDAARELREQNKSHEARWDRVLALTESLLSHQHERDMDRDRQTQRTEFRKALGGMAIEQIPTLLAQLAKDKTDTDSRLALDALSSLEPEFFDTIMSNLEPHQREAFEKFQNARGKAAPPPPPTEPKR